MIAHLSSRSWKDRAGLRGWPSRGSAAGSRCYAKWLRLPAGENELVSTRPFLALVLVLVIGTVRLTPAETPPSDETRAEEKAALTLGDKMTKAMAATPPDINDLATSEPFNLRVHPTTGEVNYVYGKDRELERIEAKTAVVFSVSRMTIHPDKFVYETGPRLITATGPALQVDFGGISLTGNTFRSNQETGEMDVAGDVRIVSKDKEGRVRVTSSKKVNLTGFHPASR